METVPLFDHSCTRRITVHLLVSIQTHLKWGLLSKTQYHLPFMVIFFLPVASQPGRYCLWLLRFCSYCAQMCLSVIFSATWHATLEICSLLGTNARNLKCIYVTLCVWRRQRVLEWEGLIVLFLCGCDGMNLGGCLLVRTLVCVFEWM